MPAEPRVNVAPALPLMVTNPPPGFAILIPCQDTLPPKAGALVAVTVLFQRATSLEEGTAVTQLPATLRAVVLLALMTSAAWAEAVQTISDEPRRRLDRRRFFMILGRPARFGGQWICRAKGYFTFKMMRTNDA